MAKGGTRAGAGRKPTGKVAMLVRVRPEVRAAVERAARRSGKSLSAQAEAIFLDVHNASAKTDDLTKALAFLVTQACTVLRSLDRAGGAPFDWRTSRSDFDALRASLSHMLDRLAPAGAVERARYPQCDDPVHAGRVAADVVLAMLAQGRSDMYAIGEQRGAATGSIFYAFPQAADALARKPDR